jgi:hypothetical protein
MRMSSDMFPFASHMVHGYDLGYCAEELKAVGDLAKKYGHRLTMHPGQFTQLASPKDNVVEQSIKELECEWRVGRKFKIRPSDILSLDHAELMDRMGLDQDGVMIIHMGVRATLYRISETRLMTGRYRVCTAIKQLRSIGSRKTSKRSSAMQSSDGSSWRTMRSASLDLRRHLDTNALLFCSNSEHIRYATMSMTCSKFALSSISPSCSTIITTQSTCVMFLAPRKHANISLALSPPSLRAYPSY